MDPGEFRRKKDAWAVTRLRVWRISFRSVQHLLEAITLLKSIHATDEKGNVRFKRLSVPLVACHLRC